MNYHKFKSPKQLRALQESASKLVNRSSNKSNKK